MAITNESPSAPIIAALKPASPFSRRKSTGGRIVSSRPTLPVTARNSSSSSRALSGILSQPEFAPVFAAGLQCDECVETAREESEGQHGHRPQDGNGQGLLAVDDPHREEN